MKAWKIFDKKDWCQHAAFKDKDGQDISFRKKEAYKNCHACCTLAALELAYKGKEFDKKSDKLEKFLIKKYPKMKYKGEIIFHVNDYILKSKQEAQNLLKEANL